MSKSTKKLALKTAPLSALLCHPIADDFYHATLSSERESLYQNLSDELVKTMHESNPIHAVKRENNFYFISSWEFISEMRRRNFSNVKVLVHPQMSDDEILDWIFQSQVAKIYLGLVSNKEIQFLHRMLDEDYRRKKDLFQNSSPRTSLTALMLLTGKTRAEMRTILGSKTMKSDLELWLEQNK